jgi:hypothetical protein
MIVIIVPMELIVSGGHHHEGPTRFNIVNRRKDKEIGSRGAITL